jgi:hypothetical protein
MPWPCRVHDITYTQNASIVGAIIGMAHNLGMKRSRKA